MPGAQAQQRTQSSTHHSLQRLFSVFSSGTPPALELSLAPRREILGGFPGQWTNGLLERKRVCRPASRAIPAWDGHFFLSRVDMPLSERARISHACGCPKTDIRTSKLGARTQIRGGCWSFASMFAFRPFSSHVVFVLLSTTSLYCHLSSRASECPCEGPSSGPWP